MTQRTQPDIRSATTLPATVCTARRNGATKQHSSCQKPRDRVARQSFGMIETRPVYDKKIIDRLATVFGFGFLITKERQIRNEILKSCKYSNVLSNRASVACEHPHFEENTHKEIEFCDGQSFPTNICGNRGRSRLVPKCLVGCELLADINEEYMNQSEDSKPSSSSNSNSGAAPSTDQSTQQEPSSDE